MHDKVLVVCRDQAIGEKDFLFCSFPPILLNLGVCVDVQFSGLVLISPDLGS